MQEKIAGNELTLGAHVQEGNCSCSFCLSLCLSIKLHLTSEVSVRPENTITYSAGNGDKTAPLRRSGTPSVKSHMYSRPFSCRKRTCAL